MNYGDVVIMLSTDMDAAAEKMHEEFGYVELGHTLELKEITGPFKSGDIITSWDSA